MTIRTTWDELRTGVEITTGHHYLITLVGPTIECIEMEDITFHTESAVVLPALQEGLEDEQRAQLTGVAALAQVLAHAEHSRDAILIAGHTDTTGKADYNLELSEQRCKSALYLLKGDRDAWAKLAHARHVDADVALLLRWVAMQHGLACDPEQFSSGEGNPERRALDSFRESYRECFDPDFSAENELGVADWAAFFNLFEETIADALGVDGEGLKDVRGALQFADPAVLACGEHWPIHESDKNHLVSQENRRVEFLFVPKEDAREIANSAPPGAAVYEKPSRYQVRYLERTTFIAVVVHDDEGPIRDAAFAVQLSDGSVRRAATNAHGRASIRGIPRGVHAAKFESIEVRPVRGSRA